MVLKLQKDFSAPGAVWRLPVEMTMLGSY